jgi:GH15 family glucan-1,4-alpha-glucosidase
LLPNFSLRVTTNAPISYVVDEILFELQEPTTFVLMPDESLKESISDITATYLEKTIHYWLDFSRVLSIPFEWQDQVIRSAITLKMCSFEETGALVASITSSVPRGPTLEGYDLRFCWLRDSSNIIHTLNKLGSTQMMEDFLKYISNIVAGSQEHGGHLQPVYGIALEQALPEKDMHRLAGYRGMGPTRVGTRDYPLVQHDVYGQVILATTQMFFDQRLTHPGDKLLFERLEGIGNLAVKNFDQPDSGPLGLAKEPLIHTFSSVMCWVATDRLKKIAKHLGLKDRAEYWANEAERIHSTIEEQAWNASLNTFTESWGGSTVDIFLCFLPELGFLPVGDKRYLSTVERVEKVLRVGKFIRCASERQLEENKNCSTTATLWFIHALAAAGRREEARELYENILSVCNSRGLLSETVDAETGELWGNFPKTTAMVGMIEAALRISKSWEEVI